MRSYGVAETLKDLKFLDPDIFEELLAVVNIELDRRKKHGFLLTRNVTTG